MLLRRAAIITAAVLASLLLPPPVRQDGTAAAAEPIRLAQADSPMNITPRAQNATPQYQYQQPQGQYQQPQRQYQQQGQYPQQGQYQQQYPQQEQNYNRPAPAPNSDAYGGTDNEPGMPYTPAAPGGPAAQGDYPPPPPGRARTFSIDEINNAGHRFFGSVSRDLAKVIQYAFRKQGEPNGYILGEEASGAFVAGLRYGEGTLYTKDAGAHKVYWQGPSLGYDFGAEGSKVMVLVYNLRSPNDIYQTFSGIDGSAYLVGGVGITFLTKNDISLAPIRSGIGLRLGANIGYLKYTRAPTWNPF